MRNYHKKIPKKRVYLQDFFFYGLDCEENFSMLFLCPAHNYTPPKKHKFSAKKKYISTSFSYKSCIKNFCMQVVLSHYIHTYII